MLPNDANVLMEWNQPSPGDYGVEMISKWLCSQKKKKKDFEWLLFSSFSDWIPSLIKPNRRAYLKGTLFDFSQKRPLAFPVVLVTKTGKELFCTSVFSFSHVCSVAADFSCQL